MKSSLLSVLMFSAVLWPAATFAQTAPDAMAKAVKADNIKWEPLGILLSKYRSCTPIRRPKRLI